MPLLWIVDRNPRRRAALARLAAASETTVAGPPGDARFESAPNPDVVILALDGDWELELQFAHAVRHRASGARWLLIGERRDERAALACFDMRIAGFFAYPPSPDALRAQIASPPAGSGPPPLSERSRREAISGRFARWFADLDLPDLLRALDPKLADVPVLICGEPGTGRSVVARYIHLFGGSARGRLAHVPCTPQTTPGEIALGLADLNDDPGHAPALTVWLEDVEQLSSTTQRILHGWVESGPPSGAVRAPLVRWIATCDEREAPLIEPGLRRSLSALIVSLPALRDRGPVVRRIVEETARDWCIARQERPRRFGEDALAVLEEYPWPGNLSELEAVVVQSLAASTSDPVRADDLQLEGQAFAPLDAGEVGTLIEEPEETPARGGRSEEPLDAGEFGTLLDEPEDAGHFGTPLDDEAAGLSERELETFLEETLPTEAERPLESAKPATARPRPEPPAPIGTSEPAAAEDEEADPLGRIATALSRQVRNPLATIRAFAAALPERFDDPSFRERFSEMVRDDVGRIDALIERLADAASLEPPKRERVDVTALLEDLLEARRSRIREQRLLVLKELDTSEPYALCDAAQLHFALDTLLGRALEWVPSHGDVYLASRHHPATPGGSGPSVRILIRFHDPRGEGAGSDAAPEESLELLIAEIVVRAQGGTLSMTSTDGEETVILIDLPAP
jgi:DNA-binding NtrC family response regulator